MRRELASVRDILKAADELMEFVATTDESRFLASKLEQSFVFHRFVIIGEAANSIPAEMRARYPRVPWARIVSLQRSWTIFGELSQRLSGSSFPRRAERQPA